MTFYDDPNRESVGVEPIWSTEVTEPKTEPGPEPEPEPQAAEAPKAKPPTRRGS